ncbi:PAS domain S-box protein [Maridesulfovibrio hydrothermalis]|uniref:histidine kinase n=1 Tax=Maridesulfovibrio hydrothermalis AM13 = DSM 14728 TaxID=1121451 RepID=L0R9P2_9BACT|nr:PAS domain S-box protein [Maridesulfovibrio hydrothermalis]CCO23464.1 PAS/PAC sensor signal transduction histidine kinase [Maridesulfovibrio hydrothermalis AM13 = DSM 14728]
MTIISKRAFGLTAQLLTPMLALVMVMGVFIFSWSFYLSKTTLENELSIDIEKTKNIIDLSLSNTLDDIKDDLIEMTLDPSFKAAVVTGDPDYIDQKLYDFMSSRQGYLLDVLTAYKDGRNWIEAGIIELPIIQLRSKFKNTMSTSPAWGYLSFRALNNIRTMLICAVPIFNEQTGEITGVLYGGIDLNSNVSFIDRLKKVSSAINAALISRNRLIISTANPSRADMRKLTQWSETVQPGQFLIEDDLIFSTIQLMDEQSDSPLIYAFSRKNPAFQSLKKNYMQNLGFLLSLATMLAIFTAWALQKRILKSLKKLTDYAKLVAAGERGTSFESGQVKEFNQLGKTLEAMVARLDENSSYISKLFSSAKAPIINCDLHGNILDLNPAAESLAGFSSNYTQGLTLSNIFPESYKQKIKQNLQLAAGGGEAPVAEIPVRSESGDNKYFIWTFSPVQMDQNGSTNFILLQGLDVTESRQAIKKARESETRLRQIINLLPQDIFANDIDGKFLLVNSIKAEKMGLNAEDITGKYLSDIIRDPVEITRIMEDDRLVLERNEKLLTEESYLDEARNIHWLETTRVPYTSTESNAPAILTISTDITRIKEVEQELQSLNKELVERVAMRTTELENANSALLKSMDDLRQTQDKLVETEKMASLGELVAGVAHEINTPLGISVTSASFMKEMIKNLQTLFESGKMKKSDLEKCIATGTEAIDNVVKNLERSAKLISNFKQLAVDQASDDIRQVNLNEYIQGILLSLKPKLKEHNHKLNVDCPPGLEIFISPGALMQVITNLVANSLTHAFPDREDGLITISARRSGNGVLINYSDDGIGMSNEQLIKVFEPFYTTARSSGSAGLGMHLVYNIVTSALKGRIECYSTLGKGTSYEIWFPVNSNR